MIKEVPQTLIGSGFFPLFSRAMRKKILLDTIEKI
jgi:hypothetical protein